MLAYRVASFREKKKNAGESGSSQITDLHTRKAIVPPRDFPLFLLPPLVHLVWRRQRKHQTSVDTLCFDRGSSVFLPEDTPRTAVSAELGERVQDHAEICSLVFFVRQRT